MWQKLRTKINGNAGKIFEALVIGGILVWMFCQVRDLPATYICKSDYEKDKAKLEDTISNGFDRMDRKIDDIHKILIRGRR